jgi:hypothetical protein
MARNKGGLNGMTVQESNNAALGQGGSMFIDTTATHTPPAGQVFISITVLSSATFTADATGLAAQDSTKYISTTGTASTSSAPGQLIDASNVFPTGITIHGRWTSIDLAGGTVIAYLGS